MYVLCTSDLFLSLSATVTENPTLLMLNAYSDFYYEGDCNDPNIQATIKSDFLSALIIYQISSLCTGCDEDTTEVYCGNVTSAERRRKRSSTMQVSEGSSKEDTFLLVHPHSYHCLVYRGTNAVMNFRNLVSARC